MKKLNVYYVHYEYVPLGNSSSILSGDHYVTTTNVDSAIRVVEEGLQRRGHQSLYCCAEVVDGDILNDG